MTAEYLHDRGRGPELIGTRITVYNLLVDFLDGSYTEAEICGFYNITPQQVAAARAYILHHYEEVMAVHRRIEERNARGNPPKLVARLEQSHEEFQQFLKWWREKNANNELNGGATLDFQSLRNKWRAEQGLQPTERQ